MCNKGRIIYNFPIKAHPIILHLTLQWRVSWSAVSSASALANVPGEAHFLTVFDQSKPYKVFVINPSFVRLGSLGLPSWLKAQPGWQVSWWPGLQAVSVLPGCGSTSTFKRGKTGSPAWGSSGCLPSRRGNAGLTEFLASWWTGGWWMGVRYTPHNKSINKKIKS